MKYFYMLLFIYATYNPRKLYTQLITAWVALKFSIGSTQNYLHTTCIYLSMFASHKCVVCNTPLPKKGYYVSKKDKK